MPKKAAAMPAPRTLIDVLTNDVFFDVATGKHVGVTPGHYAERLNSLFEKSGYSVLPPAEPRKRRPVTE